MQHFAHDIVEINIEIDIKSDPSANASGLVLKLVQVVVVERVQWMMPLR